MPSGRQKRGVKKKEKKEKSRFLIQSNLGRTCSPASEWFTFKYGRISKYRAVWTLDGKIKPKEKERVAPTLRLVPFGKFCPSSPGLFNTNLSCLCAPISGKNDIRSSIRWKVGKGKQAGQWAGSHPGIGESSHIRLRGRAVFMGIFALHMREESRNDPYELAELYMGIWLHPKVRRVL